VSGLRPYRMRTGDSLLALRVTSELSLLAAKGIATRSGALAMTWHHAHPAPCTHTAHLTIHYGVAEIVIPAGDYLVQHPDRRLGALSVESFRQSFPPALNR